MVTFKTEIQDGIEVGIVEHDGHEYRALGSVITDSHLIAYMGDVVWTDSHTLGSREKTRYAVTTWDGAIIGKCVITSTWEIPRSFVSSQMHAVYVWLKDGRHYKGRTAGPGMILRAKRTNN